MPEQSSRRRRAGVSQTDRRQEVWVRAAGTFYPAAAQAPDRGSSGKQPARPGDAADMRNPTPVETTLAGTTLAGKYGGERGEINGETPVTGALAERHRRRRHRWDISGGTTPARRSRPRGTTPVGTTLGRRDGDGFGGTVMGETATGDGDPTTLLIIADTAGRNCDRRSDERQRWSCAPCRQWRPADGELDWNLPACPFS